MGGWSGTSSEVGGGAGSVLAGAGVGGDAAGGGRGGRGVEDSRPLLVARVRWVRPRPTRPRSPLRLSLAEREEISRGLALGYSLTRIAEQLGRSTSTVSREVHRNSTATGYRAVRADRIAQARTKRSRPPKLALLPELRAVVESQLALRWSPQQISRRLRLDYPDDPAMRVSHETIYTSLFVQAKPGLPGELTVHLRSRRVRRRPHRRVAVKPPRIKDMVAIRHRPAEVEHRRVLGHWEGDCATWKAARNEWSHRLEANADGVTRFSVNRTVPALACVTGDCGVRSPGKKPKPFPFYPGTAGKGKAGRVNASESSYAS